MRYSGGLSMQLKTEIIINWGKKNLATIPISAYIKALVLNGNVTQKHHTQTHKQERVVDEACFNSHFFFSQLILVVLLCS